MLMMGRIQSQELSHTFPAGHLWGSPLGTLVVGILLGGPSFPACLQVVCSAYLRESCKRQSAHPWPQLMLELHGLAPRLSTASLLEAWME